MFTLLHYACDNDTPEDWKKVVDKCKKIIDEDWERDIRFENVSDQNFSYDLTESNRLTGLAVRFDRKHNDGSKIVQLDMESFMSTDNDDPRANEPSDFNSKLNRRMHNEYYDESPINELEHEENADYSSLKEVNNGEIVGALKGDGPLNEKNSDETEKFNKISAAQEREIDNKPGEGHVVQDPEKRCLFWRMKNPFFSHQTSKQQEKITLECVKCGHFYINNLERQASESDDQLVRRLKRAYGSLCPNCIRNFLKRFHKKPLVEPVKPDQIHKTKKVDSTTTKQTHTTKINYALLHEQMHNNKMFGSVAKTQKYNNKEVDPITTDKIYTTKKITAVTNDQIDNSELFNPAKPDQGEVYKSKGLDHVIPGHKETGKEFNTEEPDLTQKSDYDFATHQIYTTEKITAVKNDQIDKSKIFNPAKPDQGEVYKSKGLDHVIPGHKENGKEFNIEEPDLMQKSDYDFVTHHQIHYSKAKKPVTPYHLPNNKEIYPVTTDQIQNSRNFDPITPDQTFYNEYDPVTPDQKYNRKGFDPMKSDKSHKSKEYYLETFDQKHYSKEFDPMTTDQFYTTKKMYAHDQIDYSKMFNPAKPNQGEVYKSKEFNVVKPEPLYNSKEGNLLMPGHTYNSKEFDHFIPGNKETGKEFNTEASDQMQNSDFEFVTHHQIHYIKGKKPVKPYHFPNNKEIYPVTTDQIQNSRNFDPITPDQTFYNEYGPVTLDKTYNRKGFNPVPDKIHYSKKFDLVASDQKHNRNEFGLGTPDQMHYTKEFDQVTLNPIYNKEFDLGTPDHLYNSKELNPVPPEKTYNGKKFKPVKPYSTYNNKELEAETPDQKHNINEFDLVTPEQTLNSIDFNLVTPDQINNMKNFNSVMATTRSTTKEVKIKGNDDNFEYFTTQDQTRKEKVREKHIKVDMESKIRDLAEIEMKVQKVTITTPIISGRLVAITLL